MLANGLTEENGTDLSRTVLAAAAAEAAAAESMEISSIRNKLLFGEGKMEFGPLLIDRKGSSATSDSTVAVIKESADANKQPSSPLLGVSGELPSEDNCPYCNHHYRKVMCMSLINENWIFPPSTLGFSSS
ncbi:unnamed protein product [Gongylonema pulchrum]|uniref:Uncharacterized protein n=1 Tax=Gongylonema pulchrum TaxID=637853 RepID=A0A183DR37_9BILA|nr:unnamed protein product [Gongylonema pulchrum]